MNDSLKPNPTEVVLNEFDLCMKHTPAPARQTQNRKVQIGADGCIFVENPSARWVPELTLHRQIGGTVYTVTGSYSGSEMLDKKLLRVMAQNAKNVEDSE